MERRYSLTQGAALGCPRGAAPLSAWSLAPEPRLTNLLPDFGAPGQKRTHLATALMAADPLLAFTCNFQGSRQDAKVECTPKTASPRRCRFCLQPLSECCRWMLEKTQRPSLGWTPGGAKTPAESGCEPELVIRRKARKENTYTRPSSSSDVVGSFAGVSSPSDSLLIFVMIVVVPALMVVPCRCRRRSSSSRSRARRRRRSSRGRGSSTGASSHTGCCRHRRCGAGGCWQ